MQIKMNFFIKIKKKCTGACICQKKAVILHRILKEDGFDCLQPHKKNAKTCTASSNSRLGLFFY
jgi:hypothetical protein